MNKFEKQALEDAIKPFQTMKFENGSQIDSIYCTSSQRSPRGEEQIKNIFGITKELAPSKIVILYYKSKEIPIEEVYNIFTYVKDILPDNKVIAIPDLVSVKTCDKERLMAIRNTVDEMIKEIETEENM